MNLILLWSPRNDWLLSLSLLLFFLFFTHSLLNSRIDWGRRKFAFQIPGAAWLPSRVCARESERKSNMGAGRALRNEDPAKRIRKGRKRKNACCCGSKNEEGNEDKTRERGRKTLNSPSSSQVSRKIRNLSGPLSSQSLDGEEREVGRKSVEFSSLAGGGWEGVSRENEESARHYYLER